MYLLSKLSNMHRDVFSGIMTAQDRHTESIKVLLVPELLAVDSSSLKQLQAGNVGGVVIEIVAVMR